MVDGNSDTPERQLANYRKGFEGRCSLGVIRPVRTTYQQIAYQDGKMLPGDHDSPPEYMPEQVREFQKTFGLYPVREVKTQEEQE